MIRLCVWRQWKSHEKRPAAAGASGSAAYCYSPEHVERVAAAAKNCGLYAPQGFYSAPVELLAAVYNGIGPDRWNRRFRSQVTAWLEWFEPEALIHDWEYGCMPRTYRCFSLANLRFAANAMKAAFQQAMPEPRRAIYILKRSTVGALLALLCQLGGWRGYRTAAFPGSERQ